jgi:hypothetical protein
MQPRRRFVEPEELDIPIIPKGPRVATGFEAVAPIALSAAALALGPAGGAFNAALGGAGGTLFGTGAAVAGNLTSNLNLIGQGLGTFGNVLRN